MFWKCASYALCLGQQIPCTEDQHRPVPSPGTSALRVRPPAGLSLTLAACLATGDCSIYACRCRPDRGIHEMVDGEHVQRWGEKRQHKPTAPHQQTGQQTVKIAAPGWACVLNLATFPRGYRFGKHLNMVTCSPRGWPITTLL